MIARLKTIGKSAEEILSLLQETLAQWLPTQDATRIDLETSGLGYAGWFDPAFSLEDAALARAAKGFGLFSIRERLQAIGGSVRIVSVPGEGATVAMSCPLKLREGEFK